MESKIRVAIQQPSLAKYRNPVFRELARRDGLDMKLVYGKRSGLSNVEPDGFEALEHRLWRWQIGPIPLYWHSPQWTYASRKKCDVIVFTWNSQYLSLWLAFLRARFSRVGTVVWGHGFSKRESGWKLSLRKRLAKWSDAVLFYDEKTAQQYIDELGFPSDKVFVARNSLDQQPVIETTEYWNARPQELTEFRQSISSGPIILYVSRFDPNNRLDLLVQAVDQLRGEMPDVRLVAIGKGDDEERIKRMVTDLGLEQHVIFPGAIYDEREIGKWFLSSDLFCYPANIGLSLLHALGYGLPVVTDDDVDEHNPEIVAFRDGYNGLHYQKNQVGDLVEKLRMILTDQPLRQKLSEGAISTVQNEFNVATMVDGMEAAIRYSFQQKQK